MRLLAVLLVAFALLGQAARAEAPGSPEAEAAAKDLAAILSEDMVGQFTAVLTGQIWKSLEANLRAKVDAATLDEVRAEFERSLKEFTVEAMRVMPEIYARHFSASELRAMAAFYGTPAGSKALRLMPQVMTEYLGVMGPRMESFSRGMQMRLQQILSRKGYQ